MSKKTYGSRENCKKNWATFMKCGMWTGGNVLIMHVIFFSPSNENCGCYGNESGKTVAYMDLEINLKLFELLS